MSSGPPRGAPDPTVPGRGEGAPSYQQSALGAELPAGPFPEPYAPSPPPHPATPLTDYAASSLGTRVGPTYPPLSAYAPQPSAGVSSGDWGERRRPEAPPAAPGGPPAHPWDGPRAAPGGPPAHPWPQAGEPEVPEEREGRRRRRRRDALMSGALALGLIISLVGIATGLPQLWQGREGPRARPAVSTTQPPAPETSPTHGVLVLEGEAGPQIYTGTGMALTAEGEVLTAYHVVEGSTAVHALDPATGSWYELELVGYNHARDVALLRMVEPGTDFQTVTIDADGVVVGEPARVVGNAHGQGYLSEAHGTITSLDEWAWVATDDGSPAQRMDSLVRTSASVVAGYSGGPLLNADDEVVGLVVIGSSTPDPDGFAVPIADALAVVEDIRAGRAVDGTIVGPTASLGIVTVAAREDERRGSGPETQQVEGREIVRFIDGGAARVAGLEIGDVITSLDGQPVAFASTLAALLRERTPGENAVVGVVRRDGTIEDVQVVLGVRTRF